MTVGGAFSPVLVHGQMESWLTLCQAESLFIGGLLSSRYYLLFVKCYRDVYITLFNESYDIDSATIADPRNFLATSSIEA